MTWAFPTVENILELQAEQMRDFGGSPGLRDAGLLESAVHRAENKVNYDPGATVGVEVRSNVRLSLRRLRLASPLEVERGRSLDESLECRFIDGFAFAKIDGAPYVPFEA